MGGKKLGVNVREVNELKSVFVGTLYPFPPLLIRPSPFKFLSESGPQGKTLNSFPIPTKIGPKSGLYHLVPLG